MPTPIDMKNRRYGRLTALRMAGTKTRRAQWLFRCDCGTEKVIDGYHVRKGRVQSCGCLNREIINTPGHKAMIAAHAGSNKRHGKSKTPVYAVWKTMRQRCNNPANKDYPHYGGRGIRVSQAWDSFEQFASDMGPRPPGLTLERKDNSGSYCKENCRWATWDEQQNNRRAPCPK